MKKVIIKIMLILGIIILTVIIPTKSEEKEVWYREYLISYGQHKKFYYNIYGMKIWPYLNKNEYIVNE